MHCTSGASQPLALQLRCCCRFVTTNNFNVVHSRELEVIVRQRLFAFHPCGGHAYFALAPAVGGLCQGGIEDGDEVFDLEIDVVSVRNEERGFGCPRFSTETVAMSCATMPDRKCSDGCI